MQLTAATAALQCVFGGLGANRSFDMGYSATGSACELRMGTVFYFDFFSSFHRSLIPILCAAAFLGRDTKMYAATSRI